MRTALLFFVKMRNSEELRQSINDVTLVRGVQMWRQIERDRMRGISQLANLKVQISLNFNGKAMQTNVSTVRAVVILKRNRKLSYSS